MLAFFLFFCFLRKRSEHTVTACSYPRTTNYHHHYCYHRRVIRFADFQTGYIKFDDAADPPSVGSGQNLPDGDFASDTRLEFCCRDDGFTSTPLSSLPNTDPLVLFPNKHSGGKCQEIAGKLDEHFSMSLWLWSDLNYYTVRVLGTLEKKEKKEKKKEEGEEKQKKKEEEEKKKEEG